MTDQELEGIARAALNMAKRDWEAGTFHCVLASYHAGEGLRRLKRIEDFLAESLGEDWLNSGRAKDGAFSVIRLGLRQMPADAFVVVTGANYFRPTAKLLADPALAEEIAAGGADRCHEAVGEGLLTMRDAFTAVAQTRERVCVRTQVIGGGDSLEPPETHFVPQSEFGGRLKLYGDE